MKIECSVKKLKRALMLTERIVGKNLTLPVLESILLFTQNNKLILRTTNLSIGIEIKIPVKIEKEGTVAIKGGVLSSLFSNLKDDENTKLELIKENLSINTKSDNILIKSVSHEDFPTIPKVEGDSFNIKANKFIDGLKSVYYSASVSEIKPEIGSVYIYPENSSLVFVATDSFRLAEKKINIKQNLDFEGVLIPFKNIIEIIKIFDGCEDDIKISLQKTQISIESPEIYLNSRVVDGVFPDYKQIIPKQSTTEAVVLKQDLLSSLKTTNIFSDKFNQITLKINPPKKIFEIEAKNVDIGEGTAVLDGALQGEEFSASFNYKYIMDCFQSILSDSILIKMNGSNKAVIIKGVSDDSFQYLVMPMNK